MGVAEGVLAREKLWEPVDWRLGVEALVKETVTRGLTVWVLPPGGEALELPVAFHTNTDKVTVALTVDVGDIV